jgi:hypothetical protein
VKRALLDLHAWGFIAALAISPTIANHYRRALTPVHARLVAC